MGQNNRGKPPIPRGNALKYFPDLPRNPLTPEPPKKPGPKPGTKKKAPIVPMKVSQVWFCRPVVALPNNPSYIGTGPAWAHFSILTCEEGLKFEIKNLAAPDKPNRLVVVPWPSIVAYELA